MSHKFMNWARGDKECSTIFIKTNAYSYAEELDLNTPKCFNDGSEAIDDWIRHMKTTYERTFITPYWNWVQDLDTLNIEELGDRLMPQFHIHVRESARINMGFLIANIDRTWLKRCLDYSGLEEIPNSWQRFHNIMMTPINHMIFLMKDWFAHDFDPQYSMGVNRMVLNMPSITVDKRVWKELQDDIKHKNISNCVLGDYDCWNEPGNDDTFYEIIRLIIYNLKQPFI